MGGRRAPAAAASAILSSPSLSLLPSLESDRGRRRPRALLLCGFLSRLDQARGGHGGSAGGAAWPARHTATLAATVPGPAATREIGSCLWPAEPPRASRGQGGATVALVDELRPVKALANAAVHGPTRFRAPPPNPKVVAWNRAAAACSRPQAPPLLESAASQIRLTSPGLAYICRMEFASIPARRQQRGKFLPPFALTHDCCTSSVNSSRPSPTAFFLEQVVTKSQRKFSSRI